jgi:predicted GIY-YIG superfamily endonuclease
VGLIDGLTEICKGPKRNPDGRTQYRVHVKGKEIRELATEDDLESIKRAPRKDERFNVYVVQLEEVPGGTGKDVYVGMTVLTPEERYANHKRGKTAGKKIVARYGVKLLPELYDHLNPLIREEANRMEKETLPSELTAKGFKVYGAH